MLRLVVPGVVGIITSFEEDLVLSDGNIIQYPEGVVEPLRAALTPIAEEIDLAFVFGSVAKGSERAGSDIDLLVVTDKLAYTDVYSALAVAERTLGRTINPTVFTRAEWKKKRTRHDSFAARITAQPRLFVIGSDDGAE